MTKPEVLPQDQAGAVEVERMMKWSSHEYCFEIWYVIVPADEAVYVLTLRITQDDDPQSPETVRVPPEYECDEG